MAMVSTEPRRCSKCGMLKTVADFPKNRTTKTGLGSACKACAAARSKAWAAAHKDRVVEYRREYYATSSKDAHRARARMWYHANKDRAHASAAAWRARNKDAIKAKKRLEGTGFTAAVFNAAVEAQGGLCGICARKLADLPPRHTHADHDHATGAARGVLCHHCNVALGYFGDSVEVLQAAIQYLQRPPLAVA